MASTLILSLCLLSTISSVSSEIKPVTEQKPLQGQRPPPGSPWPMPKSWKRESVTFTFAPNNLALTSNILHCDLVDNAFDRLVSRLKKAELNIFPTEEVDSESVDGRDKQNNARHACELNKVKVRVNDETCPGYPKFGVKEDYKLQVTESGIFLNASSAWGIIWGFETLGQIMYTLHGKWYINKGLIDDSPRMKHRGLHLDTARHFEPVEVLKKNLDAMSSNRMNVFHWHIVDAQAFPYVSVKFPQLAQKGAHSPRQVYTQENVQDVIEYARLRGIRVIPEFDTPSHTHSWGKSMPELLTSCWADGKPNVPVYGKHAARENIDPSKNSTFQFLSEFFDEIKDVFKDDYLHMGMDEALYYCWESSPNISAFMSSIGLKAGDYPGLEQYYVRRLLDIISGMDKQTIVWQDPIDHGAEIPKTSLIQLWKDYSQWPGHFDHWQDYLKMTLSRGYDVIFSSCWYLNYVSFSQDWKDFYTCDPFGINATEEELSRIIGGEACAWCEYMDENNVLPTIWPRAAAIAEKLWSFETSNVDDAAFRLDQHRCRLLRQGIPTQPILPGYCRDDDYNIDNAIIVTQNSQEYQGRQESSEKTSSSLSVSEEIVKNGLCKRSVGNSGVTNSHLYYSMGVYSVLGVVITFTLQHL